METIANSIDTFVESRWKSPATQKTYRTGLGQFQAFLEEKLGRAAMMDDLYPAVLVDFDMWLGAKGKKDASRNTYIASVGTWMDNALLRETLPEKFSVERAQALWKDGQRRSSYHVRPPHEFMDFPKVVAALDVVPVESAERKGHIRHLVALRDRAFAWFIYVTGARQGTVRQLKIKQVRDAAGQLRNIINTKTKGDKEIVLILEEQAARRALKEYLEARDDTSEYLFVSHDRNKGQPISGSTARDIIHTTAASLGLDYSPHDARHFGAIYRVNNGMSIEIVQKWLGHSSIATTQMIYANITNDTLVNAIKGMPMPTPALAAQSPTN